MRGLGIGIIVTAILLSIVVSGKKESLSDEEIKERAEKLGMVESGVLAEDLGDNPKDAVSENRVLTPTVSGANPEDLVDEPELVPGLSPAQADVIGDGEETGTDKETEAASEKETDKAEEQGSTDTDVTKKADAASDEEDDDKTVLLDGPNGEVTENTDTISVKNEVTVTVAGGDGSYAVAKKLENAGAIDSAAKFDAYLCEKKYDRILVTGKHTIPAGASEEEIAKILTGKQ
ncbi:MAG: hypothetical protein K6G07_01600 [Lachnospiraceae bacterium]|nr:hypothetical protein [Lachnospiraceae bacterium]